VKLSRINMAIWILPVLGFLDVVTTFYVSSLGYPLERHEVGLFASYFARMGLLLYYVPLYLIILSIFSFVLWQMKNSLNPLSNIDKLIFGFLIFVLCFVYGKISATIASNILLPYYLQGRLLFSKDLAEVFVFIASVFQLVWFIKDDLVGFYQTEEGELE